MCVCMGVGVPGKTLKSASGRGGWGQPDAPVLRHAADLHMAWLRSRREGVAAGCLLLGVFDTLLCHWH